MDEKLAQILHKVGLLCEKYPEFATALKEKLKVESTVVAMPVTTNAKDDRVDKIEEYLGLDYKLDTISPRGTKYQELNYSFIGDVAVRDMLVSDFREMMRCRYGTRSHKADFMEFCKYAHFQLEGLVNYFMEAWSLDDNDKVDINKVKQNIIENWPKNLPEPLFRKEVKSIDDIDYFQKATAVVNYLQISTNVISRFQHETTFFSEKVQVVNHLSEVINHVRRVRNELSHRGKIKTKNITALIEQFESQKKPQKDAIGNWIWAFETQNDRNIKYYMWYQSTPWDDVIRAIYMLVSAVREQLC